MSRREEILDAYPGAYQELVFLEEDYFDEAILGVAQRGGHLFAVCYDESAVIELLMENNEMDYEEAMEYYNFNILDAYVGENTPVFVDMSLLQFD